MRTLSGIVGVCRYFWLRGLFKQGKLLTGLFIVKSLFHPAEVCGPCYVWHTSSALMTVDLEELDLISAVWILASNDENHLVTFEGIRERLGLDENFDVRRLVLKRRELFRPGAPPGELEDWQASMKKGSRLPTWIRIISEDSKRLATIDGLSQNDVFRSQFRANRNSPKSQVEVVSWGLEHIDRIRKSKIAASDANAKSWQMWLVFVVGVANIITTVGLVFMKGNDSSQSKPAAVVTQPTVIKDAPVTGRSPQAERP